MAPVNSLDEENNEVQHDLFHHVMPLVSASHDAIEFLRSSLNKVHHDFIVICHIWH